MEHGWLDFNILKKDVKVLAEHIAFILQLAVTSQLELMLKSVLAEEVNPVCMIEGCVWLRCRPKGIVNREAKAAGLSCIGERLGKVHLCKGVAKIVLRRASAKTKKVGDEHATPKVGRLPAVVHGGYGHGGALHPRA